jgi:hypothetical protein
MWIQAVESLRRLADIAEHRDVECRPYWEDPDQVVFRRRPDCTVPTTAVTVSIHLAILAGPPKLNHEQLKSGMARRIYERVTEARAQQDNEQWHLAYTKWKV